MFRLLLPLLFSVLCLACGNPSEQYTSFSDYPVYEGDWEEMTYTPEATSFLLWAPTAQEVRVLLYEQGTGGSPYKMLMMEEGKDGIWTTSCKEDLKGKFYTFNVKINDTWQGDTPGVMAKAVGVNGERAAIIDMRSTDPKGWSTDKRPALKSFSDIVLYEMHHRDFSMDSTLQITHHGKYLSLTDEKAIIKGSEEKAGIAHLKELGVTHVHLLPSFDFASIDETKLNVPQYNWGYDPQNYNVPEGSYATDPYRPEVRIKEFKQMVQALHKAGIRVVMDVVYNHTYQTENSNFERTVPQYFYRQDSLGNAGNASGCGNETASERPMVRRFIIESIKHWIKEYHIDGFRFDLMGIHDIATMNAIRAEVDKIDPSIFIYGEGWSAGASPLPQKDLAIKNNISQMPRIAAFSDEIRDSLRGAWGDDSKGAFLIGKPHHEEGIRLGAVGGVAHEAVGKHIRIWAKEPTQFISYVSCHDDLCLVDRLKRTKPDVSDKELSSLVKLAYTSVLTSQGVPFIFAGDEIMRHKKGDHNSYKSSDDINAIQWIQKITHQEVYDYIRLLIRMRREHPAFRLGNADLVRKHIRFLPTEEWSNVVAYQIKGSPKGDVWQNIIVILNARTERIAFNIPEGKYTIVCKDGKIDLLGGMGHLFGGKIQIAPQSALIIRESN